MIGAQNQNFLTYILLVLLARFQLGNQSAPARLGSETSQLGLARAGKIQLELITIIISLPFCMYISSYVSMLAHLTRSMKYVTAKITPLCQIFVFLSPNAFILSFTVH